MGRRATLSPCLLGLLFVVLVLAAATDSPRKSKPRKHRQLMPGITRCGNNPANDEASQQIDSQIRQAEVVFTGKVTSEFAAPDDHRGFWVKVKRGLKGGLGRGDVQLLVSKGGESEGDRCYSVIRVHHTAIFMARRAKRIGNTTGQVLVSTADPLPITLRNLDQVNALVKDMTYRPRPALLEEPCEKKYCPWGSNCVTDGADEAHCECPTECPSGSGGPVCGTDDVTYENPCLLRRKACLERDHTRMRHSGKCGAHSKRRRP